MNKLTQILLSSVLVASLNAPVLASAERPNAGPDIRILADKHQTIEEYRSHGKLYMIKVSPKKGRAYFLIDADGDGDLETRRNDLSPNLLIPSWVLFSW